MKKNICWFLLLTAIFAAMLFNPFSQTVAAQDGTQYENQGGTAPVLPEHLLQRMEMKNRIQTGEITPTPQVDRPQQPQWPVPSNEDQQYIHEWTSGVFSAWNYSTGDYDLLMRLPILSDPVLIAGSAGDELYPRLARDSSAVIYSSDESGDMEIYRMNIDGSGKTNLTNSLGDDYSAVWSLDNQWIVYVHEVNNLPQLFKMRSNGGEKQQITNCSFGCFDPTFSPDASQIAYVEKLDNYPGNTRIVVSNRDGSNKRTLFSNSNIYVPAHPSWSPEGNWIYFDYYQYPSFFSRMGWVHPDGSGLVFNLSIYPYADGYETDYWVNGWGPDSGSITVTVLHYMPNDSGQYIFTGSDVVISSGYGDTSSPLDYLFVMAEGGAAFFPDFQSADRTPPQSALESLPAFSRGMLTLEWNSSSTGLARPTELQLQRREGVDGIWQDIAKPDSTFEIWTLPKGNFAVPPGTPGSQIYFRMRAKDAAQQWEDWPESTNQMVKTTVYSWNVEGRIFDNRNNPIANQIAITSSTPIIGGLTDQEGFFHSIFANYTNLSLQIVREGYGELAPVNLPIQRDTAYDTFLPPLVNALTNGDFETNNTGWAFSGSLPVQISNISAHTGGNSLTLGEGCSAPCFSTTGEFIESDGFDVRQRLIDDLNGTLYALQYGITTTIRYRGRNGAWSDPFVLPVSSQQVWTLASPTGRYYAVYKKSDGLYGVYRDPGGEWTGPFYIGVVGNAYSSNPFDDIAVDQNNRLHFVSTGRTQELGDKYGYPLWYYEFDIDTDTLSKTTIDYLAGFVEFEINLMPGGKVLLTDSPYWSISGLVRDEAGVWRIAHQEDADTSTDAHGVGYWVGLDASNHFIFLWSEYHYSSGENELTLQSMDESLQWSNPVVIDSVVNLIASTPVRCPDGTVFFATRDLTNGLRIFRLGRGNTWELTSFKSPAGTIKLFCDSDGILAAEGIISYSERMLYEIENNSIQGTAEASQSVSIPADMEKATLSFALRLDFVRQSQQTALEVIVRDAAEVETNLLSIKKSGDWRQEWADLSPWAGQTVTIIFRLNQAAGEPKAKAWIDGVSVGSWETVFLESVEPYRFAFQQDAPFLTVHGQNFHEGLTVQINGMDVALDSITFLDENTLTVLTPDFIRPGFNSVRVANPGGAYAELPYAFRTGLELFLPVCSR